jgi:hypothetical protein
VRQATDAAVFAALIILKELGFKQVCGVSDGDQGALLDRREEEGSELEIYDPLFARVLAREASSRDSENRSTWDARARLNENSKQLGKFSEILLTGAISLANSIKSGKEFKQLTSHPDGPQE